MPKRKLDYAVEDMMASNDVTESLTVSGSESGGEQSEGASEDSNSSDQTNSSTDVPSKKSAGYPNERKRKKKSVAFQEVTVFYFPRKQGFVCVPSQGGSTLGMGNKHTAIEKFTLSGYKRHKRMQQVYSSTPNPVLPPMMVSDELATSTPHFSVDPAMTQESQESCGSAGRPENMVTASESQSSYDEYVTPQSSNEDLVSMVDKMSDCSGATSTQEPNQESNQEANLREPHQEDSLLASSSVLPESAEATDKPLPGDTGQETGDDKPGVLDDACHMTGGEELTSYTSQEISSSQNEVELSHTPALDDEMFEEEYLSEEEGEGFNLQPLTTRQRRSALRTAGVKRIDNCEREECRDIRSSRELCGCDCRGYCDPQTCACSHAGISCQVDRMAFPCGCSRDGCNNVAGRIEFNPVRVRTHFIHTLMRLEMERRREQEREQLKQQLTSVGVDAGRLERSAPPPSNPNYNSNEKGSCCDCQRSEMTDMIMRQTELANQHEGMKPGDPLVTGVLFGDAAELETIDGCQAYEFEMEEEEEVESSCSESSGMESTEDANQRLSNQTTTTTTMENGLPADVGTSLTEPYVKTNQSQSSESCSQITSETYKLDPISELLPPIRFSQGTSGMSTLEADNTWGQTSSLTAFDLDITSSESNFNSPCGATFSGYTPGTAGVDLLPREDTRSDLVSNDSHEQSQDDEDETPCYQSVLSRDRGDCNALTAKEGATPSSCEDRSEHQRTFCDLSSVPRGDSRLPGLASGGLDAGSPRKNSVPCVKLCRLEDIPDSSPAEPTQNQDILDQVTSSLPEAESPEKVGKFESIVETVSA